MLNLRRKSGQSLKFYTSDGVITVTAYVRGKQVTLQIAAPDSVVVLRDEVRDCNQLQETNVGE